jgi:hypothetical protein
VVRRETEEAPPEWKSSSENSFQGWKESSMRDSITLDCFSGLLPLNLRQKEQKRKMKMLNFS